jgi:catechol 2,3-dioxygenase-like lactoylglutathione lyase family enzyme
MQPRLLFAGLFCTVFAAAQPASLSGIAHVAFRVVDLEATRTFYNRLGFEQFFEMSQNGRSTEAFLKINDRQFIELYPRTDAAEPLGLMHICYEARDLEAVHAEYVRRGLAVSDVRKAGAGNLLMTMKDPEGQTIEFTQYMPGSRHYEDRGKHLGANRVAQWITGATTVARDVQAVRSFYLEKLGFHALGPVPARLEIAGDSAGEVDLTAAAQAALDLVARPSPPEKPSRLTVNDPDGVVLSFTQPAPGLR